MVTSKAFLLKMFVFVFESDRALTQGFPRWFQKKKKIKISTFKLFRESVRSLLNELGDGAGEMPALPEDQGSIPSIQYCL